MTARGKWIVALDIGTSGCRAAAVRPDGSFAAQCYTPLVPVRPAEGLSEYKAEELLEATRRVLHAVLEEVGPQQVAALAVASQRSTVVLWDKTTGRSVGPVLTWEDGRAQAQAAQAAISQEEIHTKTGLYKTPFFSAPKIAWMLQHVPQAAQVLRQGNLVAAPVASYIIWHLTGGKTLATDVTLAQRTLLFDIHTGSWSEDLCRAFGVPAEVLPPILPSVADYGAYVYQGVSIPVRVCVGDQQAAAAYFNLQLQDSLINYGTGAFWLYRAGEKAVLLPGMLTSLAVQEQAGRNNYFLEGPVWAAGSILLWLKAQGMKFDEADLQPLCLSAKHPVWFLPALGGLGAPYWDFTVSAAAEGLFPQTRTADWVAGTMRAIAFLLTDIASYLQENGYKLGNVQVSGGLSQVAYLTSFQADLLQRPLRLTPQPDATVLGAVRLAGGKAFAAGQLKDRTISPTLSAEKAHELYKQWQQFLSRHRRIS